MDTFHPQDCWILHLPLNPRANQQRFAQRPSRSPGMQHLQHHSPLGLQQRHLQMAQSRTDPRCLSPIVQAAPLMSLFPSPSCCPTLSHRSRVCPQTQYEQVQQMTLQFLHCSRVADSAWASRMEPFLLDPQPTGASQSKTTTWNCKQQFSNRSWSLQLQKQYKIYVLICG